LSWPSRSASPRHFRRHEAAPGPGDAAPKASAPAKDDRATGPRPKKRSAKPTRSRGARPTRGEAGSRRKAKQAADARAKQEAEARANQEADARAKQQAEAAKKKLRLTPGF